MELTEIKKNVALTESNSVSAESIVINNYRTTVEQFPKLGYGFSTKLGLQVDNGSPFEKPTLFVAGDVPERANYKFSAELLESRTTVMKALQIDAALQARYLSYSLEVSFNLNEYSKSNSSYVKWYITYERFYEDRVISSIKLKPEAEELLKNDSTRFISTYGDSYISSLTFGNKATIVYTYSTYSEEEKKEIFASAKAEMKALSGGGKVSAGFIQQLERAAQSSNLTVSIEAFGTKHKPSSIAFTRLNELGEQLIKFLDGLSEKEAACLLFRTTNYPQLNDYSVQINKVVSEIYLNRYLEVNGELISLDEALEDFEGDEEIVNKIKTSRNLRNRYLISLLDSAKEYFDLSDNEQRAPEAREKLLNKIEQSLPAMPNLDGPPILSYTWENTEEVGFGELSTSIKLSGLPRQNPIQVEVSGPMRAKGNLTNTWLAVTAVLNGKQGRSFEGSRAGDYIDVVINNTIDRPKSGKIIIQLKNDRATVPGTERGILQILRGTTIKVL